MDFVEICKVCARKAIIKASLRIFNSDKICRSYSDLNFGVTFLGHSVHVNDSLNPIPKLTANSMLLDLFHQRFVRNLVESLGEVLHIYKFTIV